AEADDGYVAAGPEEEGQWVTLSEIPLLPKNQLYGSAIQAISRAIVQHYGSRGYIGINVSPHPEDLNNEASDVRPEGVDALRLLVEIGRVTEIRTVASGDRVPDEDRVNHPKHQTLVDRSPVQPGVTDDPDRNDLLRKDALDNYVAWLNRHPGRRVDVAVSPAMEPGGVALDLMVTENKPWLIYFQASNTGTDQTSEWRERFGFNHYQLTGNDDILTLDYITASFDQAHTFLGSYEAPFFDLDRVRWRAHGTYSEFTASDVGFADEEFRGQEWSAGGDLIANIFQDRELFIDLMGGIKWQHNETVNEVVNTEGETDYFLPHIGARLERYTEESNTLAEVDVEFHFGSVADNDPLQVEFMGRLLPDDSFTRMTWLANHSFYLEPVLWRDEWLDASTPESSTLAHELAFNFRGQYSPDRLVPQFQRTAGGLHSVRGYDESLTSGDSVILATAEYRFHLPRIFGIQPDPAQLLGKPFRYAPQQPYGRPDWDLVLSGFFDYGHTFNSDRLAVETNHQLMSKGVGAEFLFKRNLNIRVDWGYVLDTVTTSGGTDLAERGDSRVHFSATLLY
ncbi:MAG: ShlB/FhaC/HecB family hemolysin secretion/activation protein, partial [Phycisphaeraceae bacterium]